ncbi:MAG: class I SAM-dependent methyltransferase [Bacteroidales bacterium]|nr:class I SAM-dependent methyltransferase [Candidatus Latescibacterota bacterium]
MTTILSLGDVYLNDFVDEGDTIVKAPLTLAVCDSCDLVQLQDTPDLDRLYRQYWYKSSLNKSMVAALQDIVDSIEQRVTLVPGDVVIDIGCNDGTMLSQYTLADKLYRIGFDPALNLADEAREHCDRFYDTYFGDTDVVLPQAKVVTTIAMFYDLEDPHTFVELIRRALAQNGIWVIQLTDLLSMLTVTAFDNICHEHLEYYSLDVIMTLLEEHDLEVFDVAVNSVNGSSLRLYVGHRGERDLQPAVLEYLLKEDDYYMRSLDRMPSENQYTAFARRVDDTKRRVQAFMAEQKELNKSVFVMGASTKGNTLLQCFDLSVDDLPFAAEVNADKFGKRTVGTNIPIISEEEALAQNPDYFFVLPWHFIDMLIGVHEAYLLRGGKLVVPLPVPCVFWWNGSEIERKLL